MKFVLVPSILVLCCTVPYIAAKPSTTKPLSSTSTKETKKWAESEQIAVGNRATRRTQLKKTLNKVTTTEGEKFVIERPASPNFGRTWKLHRPLPIQVEQVGSAKFVPAKHPGRNEGAMVYTFKALKAGFVSVEFEKIYPAEVQEEKPLRTVSVPVLIKNKRMAVPAKR